MITIQKKKRAMKPKYLKIKNAIFKGKELHFSDSLNIIAGPNGAGKSSLLDVMALLIFKVRGERSFAKLLSASRDEKIYHELLKDFRLEVEINGSTKELGFFSDNKTKTLLKDTNITPEEFPADVFLIRNLAKVNEEERKDIYQTFSESENSKDLLQKLVEAVSPSLGSVRNYRKTAEELLKQIKTKRGSTLLSELNSARREALEFDRKIQDLAKLEEKRRNLLEKTQEIKEKIRILEKKLENLKDKALQLKVKNLRDARNILLDLKSDLEKHEALSLKKFESLEEELKTLDRHLENIRELEKINEDRKILEERRRSLEKSGKTTVFLTGLSLLILSVLFAFGTKFTANLPWYIKALITLAIPAAGILITAVALKKRSDEDENLQEDLQKFEELLEKIKKDLKDRTPIIEKISTKEPAEVVKAFIESLMSLIESRISELKEQRKEIYQKINAFVAENIEKTSEALGKISEAKSLEEEASVRNRFNSILESITELQKGLPSGNQENKSRAESALKELKELLSVYPDLKIGVDLPDAESIRIEIEKINKKIEEFHGEIKEFEQEMSRIQGQLEANENYLKKTLQGIGNTLENIKTPLIYFGVEIPQEVLPTPESVKNLIESLDNAVEAVERKAKNLGKLIKVLSEAEEKARDDIAQVVKSEEVNELFKKLYPDFERFELEEKTAGRSSKKTPVLKVIRSSGEVIAAHMSKGERDHLALITRLALIKKLLENSDWKVFPVFLDEPFYSSDPERKETVWEMIIDFATPKEGEPSFQIFVTALEVPSKIREKIESIKGRIIILT